MITLLVSQIDRLRYAIEKMATWPIDSSARRWLTLGNTALILSLASQAAGLFGGAQRGRSAERSRAST